ncbi:transcription termination/antitermination factor NusG [bacterium]|nr:transcription termination/antitermination factor NusG [bacterium]
MTEHKWYVLNVHSGKEDFVAEKIKTMIEAQNAQDVISEISIPKQSKIVVKDGKKEIKKKRLLPGYILVKMNYSQQTASLLTNIEEVRGFVRIGTEVYPLTEEEVTRMMDQKPEETKKTKSYAMSVRINDAVKIVDGPFKDFIGKVSEVDESKGKVKVLITMFGRETPYDLDLTQIQKL